MRACGTQPVPVGRGEAVRRQMIAKQGTVSEQGRAQTRGVARRWSRVLSRDAGVGRAHAVRGVCRMAAAREAAAHPWHRRVAKLLEDGDHRVEAGEVAVLRGV